MTNPPVMSVIVRVVGGGAFLRRCLDHLMRQKKDDSLEIIVPFDSLVAGITELEREFPQVIFVPTRNATNARAVTPGEAHELYDIRSATGFATARGEILGHLEDYAIPDLDWCEQILQAHRQLPHGVIGGAVEHAARGTLNWAVYWLDFARYALPLREESRAYVTDVNVSYKRAALEAVRGLWVERYDEFTIHTALLRRGETLWLRPQMIVREDCGRLSLGRALAERFYWGGLFARMRMREISCGARVGYALTSPLIPFVMVARIARRVFESSRNRTRFVSLSPLVFALACVWCLGELVGYVTG